MLLYHYRQISSALPELSNGTFRFASCEELNDPLESYLQVYWQGDKAAWEGLFRNYVCSVYNAIEIYLLQGDEDLLHKRTLMIDIGRYDDVPLGKLLEKLGEEFLADDEVQMLSSAYGDNRIKVRREELQMILRLLHSKAVALCIRKDLDNGIIPESEAEPILEHLAAKGTDLPRNQFEKMIDSIKSQQLDDEQRFYIAKIAEDMLEDLTELNYIKIGQGDKEFLYGDQDQEKLKKVTNESVQHRNWLTVLVDFPKVYINQLIQMMYPESFVVCFSSKNDDSAMWGNYAGQHKGVCLIYETDENQAIRVHDRLIKAEKVVYGEGSVERNFFETFGRLTFPQIRRWLTGSGRISSYISAFDHEDEWRENYWNAFNMKNYRKLASWAYEEEYRLVIANSLYDYSKPETRTLAYDPKALKGVIFGIKTSEYDKARIVESLSSKTGLNKDFAFWQAEYDESKQCIRIRPKKFWSLVSAEHQ